MSLGPTLTTPRLILRPPEQADFDGFATMCADPETMRFLGGVVPRDAAWRLLATLAGSWALLGHGMFSVLERDTGRWVGRLGPWYPGGAAGSWPGTEVGWGLLRETTGRGYATEGAEAAIDWAVDHLGWTHVIHCIDPLNTPSIAVAERLGAALERRDVAMAPPFDAHRVDIYGQSAAAWRARRR